MNKPGPGQKSEGIARERCRTLLLTGLLIVCLSPNLPAAVPVLINFQDSPGEGFYDAVLGQSRRTAFEFAVNIWSAQLDGTITIVINASFSSMGGSANSATLGLTGPTTIHRDFDGAPLSDTWYVPSLANQLAGQDLLPADADIESEYNSDVDGNTVLGNSHWYYGLDANPPGNDIDFVSIVLHELAHGLGFIDMIDPDTGRFYGNTPSIFSRQLTQPGVGDLDAISRVQRLAALTSDNLYWNGPLTVARHGGMIKMYAPDPYESGSSISHWDPSNAADLLMEPFANEATHNLDLTPIALEDLGWTSPLINSSTKHWIEYP